MAEPRLIGEEEYVYLIAVGFNDARWFPATEFTNLSPSCLDLMRKTCITGTETHMPLCLRMPVSMQTKFTGVPMMVNRAGCLTHLCWCLH